MQTYHNLSDTTNKIGYYFILLSDIIGYNYYIIQELSCNFIGMEKNNIYIGEFISNIMAEKKVTKAELARRLKIRPQSVDYLLTRKSIDTDTLYNVSLALDYDFAILYSIKKEQINFDKINSDIKVYKAKVTVELELNSEDIIKLNLKKRLNKLLDK